jgi:hypothetical protein
MNSAVRGADARRGRVSFPLIGEDREPKVEVTNADIEAALEAEDVSTG